MFCKIIIFTIICISAIYKILQNLNQLQKVQNFTFPVLGPAQTPFSANCHYIILRHFYETYPVYRLIHALFPLCGYPFFNCQYKYRPFFGRTNALTFLSGNFGANTLTACILLQGCWLCLLHYQGITHGLSHGFHHVYHGILLQGCLF